MCIDCRFVMVLHRPPEFCFTIFLFRRFSIGTGKTHSECRLEINYELNMSNSPNKLRKCHYPSLLFSDASLRNSRITSCTIDVSLACLIALPPTPQDSLHSHRAIHRVKEYVCPNLYLRWTKFHVVLMVSS